MHLFGGPFAAANIPVVHTLHMAIMPTFDEEPEEPQERDEMIGRNTAYHYLPKIIRIGSVVQALMQFFHMHDQLEQTLTISFPYIYHIID